VFDKAAFAEAGDTAAAVAYEQVAKRIQADDGITDVLWAPYFFSGMPTFGNFAIVPRAVSYAQQTVVWLLDFLYLKGPWTWLVVFTFLGGVFMYAAASSCASANPWRFSPPSSTCSVPMASGWQGRPWLQNDGADLPSTGLPVHAPAVRAA